MNNNLSFIDCKPFLRWAGGKTWLLKQVKDYLPTQGFQGYHEPFLGGGAMLFHLQPEKAFVSDLNQELINAYEVVKRDVDKVLEYLLTYKNTEEFYYKMRSRKPRNSITRAARFIYLNRTSFNGIYRVNLNGEYNVPYGRKKNYQIDIENLKKVSKVLTSVEIKHQDFESSLLQIKAKDLVFLDPPYTVTHNNNGFIKYNSKLFDENSQIRLAKYMDTIHEIGAYFILTNAAHSWVSDTFSRPYNSIHTLNRFSRVGGVNAQRGNYEEFLITNI